MAKSKNKKKEKQVENEGKEKTTALVRRESASSPATSLDVYLAEANKFPLLTRDEEHALAVKYFKTGDINAAHKLVTSNLRFVIKVALQYSKYGVKLSDLIQEGNLGLMTAVKKFDPYRGHRLISYAVWWIKAYIQKYLLDNWSIVRLGTTQAQRKLFNSMKKVQRQLRAMEGGEPSDEAVAEALDVKPSDVADVRGRLMGRDVSLDSPLDDEGRSSRIDMMPSALMAPDDLLIRKSSAQLMHQAIEAIEGKLNKKEKRILKYRLLTDDPQTLQEIGDHFSISRERVRQIEEVLKKKLRKEIEEKLKGYLGEPEP